MPSIFDFKFHKENHTYTLGNVILPGITSVLKECGLTPEYYGDNTEARTRGSRVHAFTHYLDESDLDWAQVKDEEMGYVLAYERWKKQTGFMPVLIEKPMYHAIFLFAGTPDRVGRLPDGTKAIVELKTGQIQPAAALQTAAQEMLVNDGRHMRVAVQLNADGTFKMQIFKDYRDASMFLSALAIYQWRQSNGLIKRSAGSRERGAWRSIGSTETSRSDQGSGQLPISSGVSA